jgi:hypothetical protein
VNQLCFLLGGDVFVSKFGAFGVLSHGLQ